MFTAKVGTFSPPIVNIMYRFFLKLVIFELGIQERLLTKQHLEVTVEGIMKTIHSRRTHNFGSCLLMTEECVPKQKKRDKGAFSRL